MDETFLYQQIAESIRNQILDGRLKPGDRLPSVRQLNEQWNCTPGTVQRAYQELAHQGLVVSRSGKGTQVAGAIIPAQAQAQVPLRRAMLVNRTEAFLLEVLTAGHTLSEVQQALDLAMDRWRALERTPETAPAQTLRFAGSHDLAINGSPPTSTKSPRAPPSRSASWAAWRLMAWPKARPTWPVATCGTRKTTSTMPPSYAACYPAGGGPGDAGLRRQG